MGILAGILLVSFPAAQKRARDAQRRSDIKQYQTSAEIYANKNNGNYPNTGGNFANFCTALGLTGSSCVDDPSGGSYEVNSSTSTYQIWATLEDAPGGVQMYYISCSNGLSGDNNSEPAGSCPL
ncbi:hypothetical protein A2159_01710 [Candidatus Woesebacteria bacterium RBG_13_34_9]|uniref:Type II secretion system protein GspG C-terminal domain-containing protein n=1 Tax=Candidatus Woesebacteria bacterium RBG_13_34_9 TaxID=1802477 RepID=A0A1F7X217_9BACT|nr:MAG: hypothetical protein A2159_01710 [Candidatus Woesebacteria bacterium RBG_13_34_9]